ncbi:MAG TPA: hypothetical protein VIK61_19800 [Acidimicrobiia bacterium]
MSARTTRRLVAFLFIACLGTLVMDAAAAHATITRDNMLHMTGVASGNASLLTHSDSGRYDAAGQLGIGRYAFESTYTPGGCGDSTYTGTARLTRYDGATLSGTLTGTSNCILNGHLGSTLNAHFVLDLTHGSADLVSAQIEVDCSWPVSVQISGGTAAVDCTASGPVVVTSRIGYATVDNRGGMHSFGGAPWFLPVATPSPTPMRIAVTPSHEGYWLVNGAGRVFALGDATSFGSAHALQAGEAVRGIAATPTGNGYWLFTSLGRVLPFGAATFLGDMHSVRLNQPVVDAAAAPDGKGYWMAASDGGVFAFGSARFLGSTGGIRLNQPVVGFAPTTSGHGYWLAASDGGVFAFGDAPFRGSMGGRHIVLPVTAITRYGTGYLLVAADDGIFNFGTHAFFGSDAPAPYSAAGIVGIG